MTVKPSEYNDCPTDGDENTTTSGGIDYRADGGQDPSLDIFTRTSEVPSPTRKDRLRRFLYSNIYSPIAVIWEDKRGFLGLMIVASFFLMGTVGVLIVGKPTAMDYPIFEAPLTSLDYPLGTDNMGRPMHQMLVHATPAMLKMVTAGAVFSIVVGTMVGVIAGYKGGLIDEILMTITDIFLTIPGIVLIMVLASFYPPRDPYLVGLILAIDSWPGLSRTIRSQVLSIREQSYTEASRIMGLSQLHILWKDIISNLMPYISINFANSARGIIFSSVALYFLGILPFTTFNWGVMLNEAYQTSDITDPSVIHWLYVPMLAIVLFSVGLVMFAQSLDRVFNVRLRAKNAETEKEEGATSVPK